MSEDPSPSTLSGTIVGLAIALILPFFLRLIPKALPPLTRLVIHEVLFWSMAVCVVILVVFWEKLPLSSIGFRRLRGKTILIGLAGFLVMMVAYALSRQIEHFFHLADDTAAGLRRVLQYPVWLRLLLVFRAGIVEETLYRGYAIERLTTLTGSKVAGGLIPLAVFSAAHLFFWGPAHLILVVTGGLVLTLLYFWRRDLSVNIVAHFLTDFMGVFVAPLVAR